MIRISELKLPLSALPTPERRPSHAPSETEQDRTPTPHPVAALHTLAAQALGVPPEAIDQLQVFKRSFDARKADLLAVYIADVRLTDEGQEAALLAQHAHHPHITATPHMAWQPPVQAPPHFGQDPTQRPIVIGFGPCGMFAALCLAQMGLRPIVIERGKTVRQRTQDTWGLWRKQQLNPESNVQFGEGGAGTFSDGKLYSQIKDPRHLGRKVMNEFVQSGAPADILYAAHPHIGTFKLVKVVEHIRQRIIALGGEVLFEHRVSDITTVPAAPGQRISGLQVDDLRTGQQRHIDCQHVVLALGHSARDTFVMLHQRGVALHAKDFSVGVRIEHPQSVIDQARWGRHAGHPLLGAADYKLVHHAKNGRAVYSFCMCPGGTVVAATSEAGRVVTNGMSQYSRNERNANAGMVVGIGAADMPTDTAAWQAAFGDDMGAQLAAQAQAMAAQTPAAAHPLAGIVLQRLLESRAFELGGGTYHAPAQRVGDFLAQRPSTALGLVQPSYQPGVRLCHLDDLLPAALTQAMREALPAFAKKIKGYDMADAILTGVETRTSSPLRIPRGADFQSTNTQGLYPAGEGASYAGGILSAGVDGIKVAEAVARAICR